MRHTAVKADFAARLNELLDERGLPRKGDGRQTTLARIVDVGQKGVRKWLEGEGLPTLENTIKLAKYFSVHTEWLLSGRGPKYLDHDGRALMDSLPKEVRQETIDFLEFKLHKQLQGEKLARYLRWLDHLKNHPPGEKGEE